MKENINESLIPESLPMIEFTNEFQEFLNPKEILGINYREKPDKALEQKIRHTGYISALRQGDIGTKWFIADHNAEGLDWPKKIPDEAKYDLIFGDFPFGLRRVNYLAIEDNLIGTALTYLSDNGTAVFITATSLATELQAKLPIIGFNVHAIIKAPNSFPDLYGIAIEICVVVIGKKSVDKVFYAELDDDNHDYFLLIDNFTRSQDDLFNLEYGMFLPLDYDFLGFRALNASLKIEELQSVYKDYTKFTLEQLAIEINAGRQNQTLREKNNSIYIPRVGISPVINSISKGKLKHHHYFQVVLKNEANNKYVSCFYQSKIGKLTLDSMKSGFIGTISKSKLKKLSIPLPDIDTQKKIIAIDEQISNVQNNLNLLKDELAVNPLNVSTLTAIDNISASINELTTADSLRGFILSGESKTIEFKETFSLNIHSKQKDTDIENSSLKTIAGFLNSLGGKLFIGINDSQEIIGVDIEVDKFYQGSLDKYLLHFKNNIEKHIGLEFSDYIDYGIQTLEGVNVLVVDCLESLKPCFLDEKDFYVRTNPSTDKLEGEKQYKYIQSHFKRLKAYNEILEFIEENEIICPMPIHWRDLHRLIVRRIHGKEAKGMNVITIRERFGIAVPLVLGGWYASNSDKKEVFLSHIQVAAKNNIIKPVKQFLLNLSLEDFLHGDGLSTTDDSQYVVDEDWDVDEIE